MRRLLVLGCGVRRTRLTAVRLAGVRLALRRALRSAGRRLLVVGHGWLLLVGHEDPRLECHAAVTKSMSSSTLPSSAGSTSL